MDLMRRSTFSADTSYKASLLSTQQNDLDAIIPFVQRKTLNYLQKSTNKDDSRCTNTHHHGVHLCSVHDGHQVVPCMPVNSNTTVIQKIFRSHWKEVLS